MDQALLKQQELVVSTYDEFLIWVEEKPDRHREATKQKMEALQKSINGNDPICFLYGLYYEENKSLVEILKVQEISSIDFLSKATLHRLLFERFGWKPRENTERTPVHEKKLNAKVKEEIEEFEEQVKGLLHGRVVARVFKMKELESKQYRIGRALYILKTLGGIDKNILFRLSKEGGLSNAILAKSLNKELSRILERNPELGIELEDVELYPQSIDRWFKYKTQQRELEYI